jgi:hypothetical protein
MNSYEKIYNILLEEAFLLEQRKPMTTRQKIGAGVLAGLATFGAGKALKSSAPTAQAQPKVEAPHKPSAAERMRKGKFTRDLRRKAKVAAGEQHHSDRIEQEGGPTQGAGRIEPNVGQRRDPMVIFAAPSGSKRKPHKVIGRGEGALIEPKISGAEGTDRGPGATKIDQSKTAKSGRKLLQSVRGRSQTAVRALRSTIKRAMGRPENIGLTSTVTRETKGKEGETTGTMRMGRGRNPFGGDEYRSTKPRAKR